MQAAMFNTLEYVKLLIGMGFSQSQAEGLNEAQNMVTHAILSQVANSADLKDLRITASLTTHELRAEINELRTENRTEFEKVRAEINELRIETRTEFEKVRAEMSVEFQKVRSEMHKEVAELKECITKASSKNFFGLATIMGVGLTLLGLFG